MIKTDCFAFRQEKGIIDCKILEDIYCKYQDTCKFYKTPEQHLQDREKADKINQTRKAKKS